MKLSTLSILLGTVYALVCIWGLLDRRRFTHWLRGFHRNLPFGVMLMLLGTAWFEYNLAGDTISDFKDWKPLLQILFAAAGVGACFFLQDYLSIRGLAIVMLMGAFVLLETQRSHESPWKNVITTWAYGMIVMAMWFVVSPWRARDWIGWHLASENRLRTGLIWRTVLGVFVAVLGLTLLK